MIAHGFFVEDSLQFLELLGILRSKVIRLAEVLIHLVKFPHVVLQRRERYHQPRERVPSAGDPAFVVDAAVAEHLEVLRGAALDRLRGVGGVEHGDAVHGPLRDAINGLGLRDPSGFERGRGDIDDMVKLAAHFALRLDALRPVHDHAIARTTEVRGNLLGPLKGGVGGPSPADGEVRESARVAPRIDVVHHLVGFTDDAVEGHHLIVGALGAALGARSIVADDIEEERILQLTNGFKLRHQATDFMVGVLSESGESFHLALKKSLLFRAHILPRGDFRRPRRELGFGGNHAEPLLPLKGFLSQLFPAAGELAFILGDPLLRRMMRCVRGTGGKIHIERLVRGKRLLRTHPANRLIRHIGRKVIIGRWFVFHARHAVEDRGRPLVRLAADETIELVKTRSRRPPVIRAGRRDFPRRRLVVFAKGGSAKTIVAKDLRQRRDRQRADARIAGKRRRQLHDRARIVSVMIVSREQRRARRTAQRRGVKTIITQPSIRHLVERRHLDRPAKCTARTKTDVIDQHDHHIRGALRRLHLESRRRLRIAGVQRGHRHDRQFRNGQ